MILRKRPWTTIVYYYLFLVAAVLVGVSAGLPQWAARGDDRAKHSTNHVEPPSSSSSLMNLDDGSVCNNNKLDEKTQAAENELYSFLKEESASGEDSQPQFHIQGWRWHTMSLIRESSRLQKAAQKLIAIRSSSSAILDSKDNDNDDWNDFTKAASYVVNFNMKGLHKIEKTLFFPWVRQRISQLAKAQERPQVATAFGTIMDHLERQRRTVEQLGSELVSELLVLSSRACCPCLVSFQVFLIIHSFIPTEWLIIDSQQKVVERGTTA